MTPKVLDRFNALRFWAEKNTSDQTGTPSSAATVLARRRKPSGRGSVATEDLELDGGFRSARLDQALEARFDETGRTA